MAKGDDFTGLDQTDDSIEGQLLDQMVAEAVEYVHIRAPEEVINTLKDTANTSETMGALTYKITRGILEKHREAGLTFDVDMNLAMGLATETTDILAEVVERVNPNASMNIDKVKEDALIHSVVLHGEQLDQENDPKVREEAKAALRGYMQDGTTDQAFDYVNRRAENEGLNTNDMMRAGSEIAMQGAVKDKKANPLEQAMQAGSASMPPANEAQPVSQWGTGMAAPNDGAPVDPPAGGNGFLDIGEVARKGHPFRRGPEGGMMQSIPYTPKKLLEAGATGLVQGAASLMGMGEEEEEMPPGGGGGGF